MATKTLINSLFLAVRHGDYAEVQHIIEADHGLVHACRTAPPKKDDGQSPLQVACKTGHFTIANYLLDKGANVNYIEESSVNEWRAPVLHDAIRATVFNVPTLSLGEAPFAEAITLLRRMLELGADPNATDSHGNSGLIRAVLDLRQLFPSRHIVDRADAPRDPQFDASAKLLLGLLFKYGAAFGASSEQREVAKICVCGRYLERFFAKNVI